VTRLEVRCSADAVKKSEEDLNVSAEGPEQALNSQQPSTYRRLPSRLVYPSGRLPNSSG